MQMSPIGSVTPQACAGIFAGTLEMDRVSIEDVDPRCSTTTTLTGVNSPVR